MEKRQKDISQNRWLPLLRGRSHKGSSVETGVCLDFPRPGGPLAKGYPLGGRENKKTSIKTGVCPDCPVGKGNALRGRSHKGTSVKTGFSPPASPKGSLRIQTGSHDQTRYLQTLCPEIPNRQRKKKQRLPETKRAAFRSCVRRVETDKKKTGRTKDQTGCLQKLCPES